MVNAYRNLLPSTVGFDRLLSTFDELNEHLMDKKPTYPPYNIYKVDDTHYKIEIAVAGFKQEELQITSEGNKVIVTGTKPEENSKEYLYKGIATRDFQHTFTLAETIVVRSAEYVDGILEIVLKNIIPEEKKPRTIPIQPSLDRLKP
jgi:molecular chaperone IbpA